MRLVDVWSQNMSHWAEVDENGFVLQVLVGNNDEPDEGYSWFVENLGGTWIKTSYNTLRGIHYNPETGEPSEDQSKALRGNYAGIGYFYNKELDAFFPPKPYNSWVIDETNYDWVAPVPKPVPDDDKNYFYEWDEGSGSWIVELMPDREEFS
jgi:hypothetical protein